MLKPKGLGQDTLIGSSCGGANSISSHAVRRSHFQFYFAAMANLRGHFPDTF